LIVDPVVSAVSGDGNSNTEVRRALQPIVDLAARLDCATLGISHFTKGSDGRDVVERVTGSLAFGAAARIVLAAAKLKGDDERTAGRIVARAKSNIGPDSGGFGRPATSGVAGLCRRARVTRAVGRGD
jgi:putative DNA primase/helicase